MFRRPLFPDYSISPMKIPVIPDWQKNGAFPFPTQKNQTMSGFFVSINPRKALPVNLLKGSF